MYVCVCLCAQSGLPEGHPARVALLSLWHGQGLQSNLNSNNNSSSSSRSNNTSDHGLQTNHTSGRSSSSSSSSSRSNSSSDPSSRGGARGRKGVESAAHQGWGEEGGGAGEENDGVGGGERRGRRLGVGRGLVEVPDIVAWQVEEEEEEEEGEGGEAQCENEEGV